VTFEELRTLLEAYGFELLRVAGSHYVFLVEINGIERTLSIPYKRPHIKFIHVKQALSLIDEIEGSED
jgi:predicted RNA binding protein YcfA (HicA-like mRNA interferase family)